MMSEIHLKTIEVVEETGLQYIAAREVAAKQLVAVVVANAISTTSANTVDEDYKDRASTLSSAIWDAVVPYDRMTRKVLSESLNKLGLLNGYSCPRAFWDGLGKFQSQQQG